MLGSLPKQIGRYQIAAKLGEGAFGEVYQAYDPTVGRPVAIKVLRSTDQDILSRFKNEATLAGNLRHKNIVTIYEFGEHHGEPYIAMEYLNGQDLQQVLRSGRPLEMLQKVSIMAQVAEGLECAHRNGVIHRDVKPANIMLLADGTVKLMDFGIARLTGSVDSHRLTQQGDIVGTLLYMAPEQLAPSSIDVDALCDIFAYGEIYYELLAGKHPFAASDARLLIYKVTSEDPPLIQHIVPDCPPELGNLIGRLLRKNRDARCQSMREVLFESQPVLIELQQERAAALIVQAQDLFDRRQFEAADALLPEILQLDPSNRSAHYLWESINKELRDKPKIEGFLKTAREHFEQRRFYEAVLALESARHLDSANREIQSLLEQAQAALQVGRKVTQLISAAWEALERQNLPAAYKHISEAVLLDPDNAQAQLLEQQIQGEMDQRRREQRIQEGLAKAETLLLIRQYDEGLSELLQLDSSDPRVARLQERLGREKREHERAFRLQSGMASATELLRQGRFSEAVTSLEQLSAEFSSAREVQDLLSYARAELGRREQREAVEQIAEEARQRADRHDFAGALVILEQAVQRYEDPSLVRLLGTVAAAEAAWRREEAIRTTREECDRLRQQGELAAAIRVVEKALQNYVADPALLELLHALERECEHQRRNDEILKAVAQVRKLLDGGQFERALRLLPDLLRRYPETSELTEALAEAQSGLDAQKRARAVELVEGEARSRAAAADFEGALQVATQALNRFPGDPRLQRLVDQITNEQAGAVRHRDVQQSLKQANELAADKHFVEALEAVAAALSRYEGEDALLEAQRKLQRDWEQYQRSQAVAAAAARTRALLEERRPEAARDLVRDACSRYPGEPELQSLLEKADHAIAVEHAIADALRLCDLRIAQDQFLEALPLVDDAIRQYGEDSRLVELRTQIAARMTEAEQLRKRNSDLNALLGLRDEVQSLSDPALVARLGERVRAIAGPYSGDPEIKELANDILRQLAIMDQVVSLLAAHNFSGALELCDRSLEQYPNHPLLGHWKSEAERSQKAASLGELRDQLAAEVDLARKAKVLDQATHRYPEEDWLRSELHRVRETRAMAEAAARKARLAEQTEDWDEAVAQWNAVGQIDSHYPDLNREIELASGRARQARMAARNRRVEQIRRHLHAGDYTAAAEALKAAQGDLTGDPELQSLAEQVAAVPQAVSQAQMLSAASRLSEAVKIVESALARYPADLLLQRELQSLRTQLERQDALEAALASARNSAEQGCFADALAVLDSFSTRYGPDRAVAEVQDTIRRRQEQYAARIREIGILLGNREYPQAARLAADSLVEYPGDRELIRLQAEIEARSRSWEAELAEKEIQKGLSRAADLISIRPSDAVELLVRLCERYPTRGDLAAELARARYAEVAPEVERLCDQEEFLEAAERLDQTLLTTPDARTLREKIEARRETANRERLVRGIESARALMVTSPREAIDLLNPLQTEFPERTDLAELLSVCRQAVEHQEARRAARERLSAIQQQVERRPRSGKLKKLAVEAEQIASRYAADDEIAALAKLIHQLAESTLLPQVRKAVPRKLIAAAVASVAAIAAPLVIPWLIHRNETPILLAIRTDLRGILVTIGDRSCVTPNCRIELPPGRYTLEARLSGYEPVRRTLDLSRAQGAGDIDIKLKPIPEAATVLPPPVQPPPPRETRNIGTLAVVVNQNNVRVLVNDKPYPLDAGRSLTIPLEANAYTVAVEKPGFRSPPPQRVQIRKNDTARVVFILSPVVDGAAQELNAWNQVSNSNDIASLQSFLDSYPSGLHAADARSRIQQLKDIEAREKAAREKEAQEKQAREREAQAAREREAQAAREREAQAAREREAQLARERQLKALREEQAKAAREQQQRDQVARADIAQTLNEYKNAFNAKNRRALQAVWPNIPQKVLADLTAAFSHGGAFRVDLQIKNPPEIRGDTASVSCLRTVSEDGKPTSDTVSFHFQRFGERWLITGIN